MVRCVRDAVIVGVLLLGIPAFAGDYCYTRGRYTYCDSGTTFYRTKSNSIIVYGKDGKTEDTYHKYGNHLYGSDGSWRAKHGKGNTTDSLKKTPTTKDRVLDEIFGNGDW